MTSGESQKFSVSSIQDERGTGDFDMVGSRSSLVLMVTVTCCRPEPLLKVTLISVWCVLISLFILTREQRVQR